MVLMPDPAPSRDKGAGQEHRCPVEPGRGQPLLGLNPHLHPLPRAEAEWGPKAALLASDWLSAPPCSRAPLHLPRGGTARPPPSGGGTSSVHRGTPPSWRRSPARPRLGLSWWPHSGASRSRVSLCPLSGPHVCFPWPCPQGSQEVEAVPAVCVPSFWPRPHNAQRTSWCHPVQEEPGRAV